MVRSILSSTRGLGHRDPGCLPSSVLGLASQNLYPETEGTALGVRDWPYREVFRGRVVLFESLVRYMIAPIDVLFLVLLDLGLENSKQLRL